jgi:hypothetical protein
MVDLERFIHDLNSAWLEGRYDDLRRYFHPNVVMLPPGGADLIVGIDPMLESYRRFGSLGTVHSFEILNVGVYPFEKLAVCQMSFTIDYEIEAERFKETGLEVYALDTSGEEPRIVWRTQMPGK